MVGSIMLFLGAAIVIAWGIAHIAIPTSGIIASFEPLSDDNRRILLMEWIMEGVLLIFLGVLVAAVRMFAPEGEAAATIVYRASALVLIAMAVISGFTGARTPIVPMKLCPPIFTTAAVLFWVPTFL